MRAETPVEESIITSFEETPVEVSTEGGRVSVPLRRSTRPSWWITKNGEKFSATSRSAMSSIIECL